MQPADTGLQPHRPTWINETFASLFIINPLADVFILWLWRQPRRNQVPQRDNKAWKSAVWSLRQGRAGTYTTFNVAVFGGGFTAVMMGACAGQHLRMNRRMGGGREGVKHGITYCFAGGFLALLPVNCLSLLAGSGRKAWLQTESQNGWEFVPDRHHELGEEPHFSGTAPTPHLCRHLTDICFIVFKKWNTEKTNEERRYVAAHILEWKNWAIICYFAVNISTLRLQPLK